VTQLQLTKERFGIEPEPGDPVFFDPNVNKPQEFNIELYEKELITVMVKGGLDPATYYAFQKTGIFITRHNWDNLSPKAQEEWMAALNKDEKCAK
jgi:hypothetical protein